jgi:hypothetical protein
VPPPGTPVTVDTSNRCAGSLSLFAFGTSNNAAGPTYLAAGAAWCLHEPNYTVPSTITGPPFTAICNISDAYSGYPSQLFRLYRADWDGHTYKPNQSGMFARILHRPTGLYLGPSLESENGVLNPRAPISGANLRLTSGTLIAQGYWWILVPQINDPTYTPPIEGTSKPYYLGRPQIAYVPDPAVLPASTDAVSFWYFLTTSSPPILVVSPAGYYYSAPFIAIPYLIVDRHLPPDDPEQLASVLAAVQYLDYNLIPIITFQPTAFDFYGPFPPVVE